MKPGLQISVPEDFLIVGVFKSDLPLTDILVFNLIFQAFSWLEHLQDFVPLGSQMQVFMQLEGTWFI